MADNTVQPGASPAKLTRTDTTTLLAYAAGALLITFLPQILAFCGVL